MLKVMNRDNFDWNKVYNGRGIVINCKTEEDANDLLRYLDSKGAYWTTGNDLLKDNNYNEYAENTCYYINAFKSNIEITYNNISFFEKHNYKVYKWENTPLDLSLFDNIFNSGLIPYDALFRGLFNKWQYEDKDKDILFLVEKNEFFKITSALQIFECTYNEIYEDSPIFISITKYRDGLIFNIKKSILHFNVFVADINSKRLKTWLRGRRFSNIIIDKVAESPKDVVLPFRNEFIHDELIPSLAQAKEDKLTLIY